MDNTYSLEDFECEEFAENLEDVVGRTYEKVQLMAAVPDDEDFYFNQLLQLTNYSMYLFSAPTGYGKSYLAECFAQTMLENDYQVYQIDCEEFMEEEAPESIWKSLLEECVKKSDPEGFEEQKVCLYLQNLSAVESDKKCTRAIAKGLKKISNCNCRCIVLATDNDFSKIPSLILKQFVVLELGLPDEEERTKFFEKFMEFYITDPMTEEDVPFYLVSAKAEEDDEEDLERLAMYCAEKTEGLSFGQLMSVMEQVLKAFKMRLKIATDNDFSNTFAQLSAGTGCCVEEAEFLAIIAKVKKIGDVLKQSEAGEKSAGDQGIVVAPVINPPQVVVNVQANGAGGGTNTVPVADDNQMSTRDLKIDAVTNDDNPTVAALVAGFGELPSWDKVDDCFKVD